MNAPRARRMSGSLVELGRRVLPGEPIQAPLISSHNIAGASSPKTIDGIRDSATVRVD